MFQCSRSSFSFVRSSHSRFFSTNPSQLDGAVVGVYKSGELTKDGQKFSQLNEVISSRWTTLKKKKGDHLLVPTNSKDLPPIVALIGLGEKDETTKQNAREAATIGISVLRDAISAKKIGVDSFGQPQASAEGSYLGIWTYKKSEEDIPVELVPLNPSKEWETGVKIAEAQNFCRILADTPSNLLTPRIFTEKAKEKLSSFNQIKIEIRDQDWIKQQKMGCLIGVSQGSAEPPRFMEIHYKGGNSNEFPIALVGKGITFDSGGISIKPSAEMGLMRGDMAGAATVVSTMFGLGNLGIKKNVIGLIPLCENMPSGTAVKPGDVLTSMSGKTIEVDNTDAEGRLVLADALHYAKQFTPNVVIDIATLTGAMQRALGDEISGVFSTDDIVWEKLISASEETGEAVWRMPLFSNYKRYIKSNLADIKNSSPGPGAITAALFLQNFVDEKWSWMHMDIAGVSQRKTAGRRDFNSGMTGTPVRTLIEFIRNF